MTDMEEKMDAWMDGWLEFQSCFDFNLVEVLMIIVEEQTCLGIISSEKCYQSSKHGQCITVNGDDFFPMLHLLSSNR